MFDQALNHKVITVTACFVTLMVGGLVQTIWEVKHKIVPGISLMSFTNLEKEI